MKAIHFSKPGAVEISEIPLPVLNQGEALIKVKYSGICGSDLHVMMGHHPSANYPLVPGHEFVGELISIKDNTRPDLQPGDLVIGQPFYSCGVCDSCISGHDNVCTTLQILGIHRDGSFAEYVKVLARKVFRLAEDLDPQLATLIEPLAVAVHDVRKSGLKVGENCLIIGGGPIGVIIAMVARLSGANRVVISEVSPFRIEFAKSLGFATINPLTENLMARVNEMTVSKGFDVVFEVSGSKAGIAAMTDVAKINGTVMIVGMANDCFPVNTTQAFIKELTIQGVRIHSQVNFAAAITILENGKLNESLMSLISAVYPLSEGKEAFELAAKGGEFFKILVRT
jgi:2-desacetyl-2-hydroxyethyl bacteriochlorophyllide A dehydrogenase